MKSMLRRISALLIAAIMVVAMCVPAMAETQLTAIPDPGYPTERDSAAVEVKGFVKGQVESVTAYQIVDAEYDVDGQLGFSGYVAVKDLLREAALPAGKVNKNDRVQIFGYKKDADGKTQYTYEGGDGEVTVYSEDGTNFVDESGAAVTLPDDVSPVPVFTAIYPTSSQISLLAEDSSIVGEGKGVALMESADGKTYSGDLTVGEWLVIAKPSTGSDTVYNPMLVSVYYVVDENGVEQIAVDPITANDHWGGKLDVEDAYIKSSRPTLEKVIVKNSREAGGVNSKAADSADHGDDHAIGDTVDFKATSMIPSYSDEYIKSVTAVNNSKKADGSYYTDDTPIRYEITDTMEPGLTYLTDQGIVVIVGEAEYDADGNLLPPAEEYRVSGSDEKPVPETGEAAFTYNVVKDDDNNIIGYKIAFAQDYILSHDAEPVTITYSARLNEDATVNYDANENTVNLTYTLGHDPLTETDDNGEKVVKTDDQGNPIVKKDDDGNPIPKRDDNGNPIPMFDDNGNPIPAVDANGNKIPRTDDDGNIIYKTDENGELIPKTDPQGNPIPKIDQNGNPVYKTDEDGNPIPKTDNEGNPIIKTDDGGNPILKTDDEGNPIPVTDAYGNPVLKTDEDGNPIPKTDDEGNPILKTDDEGNPIPKTDENGYRIYDDNGNPVYEVEYEPLYEPEYVYEPEYEYEPEYVYIYEYEYEYETEDDVREIEDTTYHYTFEIDGDVLGETDKSDDDDNPDTPDQTEHRTHELVKLNEYGSEEKNQNEVDKGDGKTETRHVSNPLAGAIFELTRTDDFKGDQAEVYYAITDEDGLFGAASDNTKYNGKAINGFTGLDTGTYTMKEVKAPAGYTLNKATYTITISAQYYNSDAPDYSYKKGMLRSYTINVKNDQTGDEASTTHVATYQNQLVQNDNGTPDDPSDDVYTMQTKTIVSDIVNGVVSQASTLIKNTKLTDLPSTGGIGSYLFTIIGVAVMAVVAGSYFRSRAKRV